MLIEQALFTSTQSQRFDDYRLTAVSPGVTARDQEELCGWSPRYNSLIEQGDDAVSINFHRLGSGAYCISKTSPTEGEYGGLRQVVTQCLLVPREILQRFANNPLAVLAAAFAQGSLRLSEKASDVLDPFRLSGRASAVDQAVIARVLAGPGVLWLQAVVQAAIRWRRIAIAGPDRLRMIAGLINCLPVSHRPDFSFSTGLKFCEQQSFRVQSAAGSALPRDDAQSEVPGAVLLDLAGKPPQELTGTQGYSGFVACAITTGKVAFLAQQLTKMDAQLTSQQLDALGDELLEALARQASSEPRGLESCERSAAATRQAAASPAVRIRCDAPQSAAPSPADSTAEAPPGDAAVEQLMTFGMPRDPAQRLGAKCPEAVELLEALDDAAFEAIAGKQAALESFRTLWPKALEKIKPELIEEAREQYIRHALDVWNTCVEGEQVRDPAVAIRAIEVINLLFEP